MYLNFVFQKFCLIFKFVRSVQQIWDLAFKLFAWLAFSINMCTLSLPLGYGGMIPEMSGGMIPLVLVHPDQ